MKHSKQITIDQAVAFLNKGAEGKLGPTPYVKNKLGAILDQHRDWLYENMEQHYIWAVETRAMPAEK